MPLPVVSDNVTEEPEHTGKVPIIAEGVLATVTGYVAKQDPTVYVIVVLPEATPVAAPVDALMLAIAELAEDHEPKPRLLLKVVATPVHKLLAPVIAPGCAPTVTENVACGVQPVA